VFFHGYHFPFGKHSVFWQNHIMKKKSLLETNPYLKDADEREAGIVLNVATSSAIEGVSLSVFGSLFKTQKNQTGKTFSANSNSILSPRRKSSPSGRSSNQDRAEQQ
jgi:hypothetical protein